MADFINFNPIDCVIIESNKMIHVSKMKACVKKQKGSGHEQINNEIKPNIIPDRGVLKLTNILKVITKCNQLKVITKRNESRVR